jgi:hypothetical protein
MTSLVLQSPSIESVKPPIEQKSRWLRFVLPSMLIIFTSLLFWLTYTFQHSCTPLVGQPPTACYIAGVTIQPEHLESLVRGNSKQLIAKVELKDRPKNDRTKFTKKVDWKSTHPEVAAITQKGILIVKMPGETEIIAISQENSNKWATLKVKVEPLPIVTKIEFLPNELSRYEGEDLFESKDFSIEVKGERNFDKSLKYESGNAQIAYVEPSTNSKKLKIELKSSGKTYITAISTVDPKQKGSIKITALPSRIEEIQIEDSHLELYPKQMKKLKVTFEGQGNFDRSVIWSSDHANIAEVNSDGVILAKEEGKTLISVVSKTNSNIMSFVEVTVQKSEVNIIIPAVVGGVCLVTTTSMLVPPPLSVPMCGAFAGGFYWLLNH